jgi:hypothetical protein
MCIGHTGRGCGGDSRQRGTLCWGGGSMIGNKNSGRQNFADPSMCNC